VRNQIRRILLHLGFLWAGFLVGALALPLILAGDIYDYQDTVDGVHLPPVDVIVCLAGGRGRIAAAGDLWYRYWEIAHRKNPPGNPPLLYISGMGPQSNWSVLMRQLRAGVRPVVQPENVLLETDSQNTESNALWLARNARKYDWKRILLITSAYHMRRATLIFDKVLRAKGHVVEIQTLSAFQDPFEPGEWRSSIHGIHVTIIEYIKWVYYKYLWKA
jgi:uncharacterized SAM-binding protein YcdF (DUF218 family)